MRITTGAKYASGILKAPNNMGPLCAFKSAENKLSMRFRSLRTASLSRMAKAPISGRWASMFMGQALRIPAKPLCISAQMLRARARSATAEGQSFLSGNFSATYSAMARVSQTAKSPSTSTGTLPTGLMSFKVFLNIDCASKPSKRTITSSKSMPACLSMTQGRMDHEE